MAEDVQKIVIRPMVRPTVCVWASRGGSPLAGYDGCALKVGTMVMEHRMIVVLAWSGTR